ncbi:MAG: polysaccharide deacetylase family protein [Candidatus Limnocylindrales bacterium]
MSTSVALPQDLAVLMYHYVRPADPPMRVGAGCVDLDTFGAQLDDLQRHAAVVSWPQVAAAMAGGAALPPDAVLLTFDDGEDDHHRYVLPMLTARGLSGTFFVMARDPADGLTVAHRIHVVLAFLSPAQLREAVLDRLSVVDRARFVTAEAEQARHPFSDPVDDLKWVLQRDLADAASPILSHLVEELAGPEPEVAAALHLDARQVADLHAAGMTLGGHTRDHVWIDFVDPTEARRQLAASRAQLEALEPGGAWPFAYPFGGIPGDPAALVAPAGFAAAFAATATDRADRWRLGRVDAEILGRTPTAHPRFAPAGAVRAA